MKSDEGSGPTENLPGTGHAEGEAVSKVRQEDPGMTSDIRVGCRYRTPLFQSESIVDDAGRLIRLQYVDMRTPEARLPITTVIKGCSQKYAIETYPTMRISKPSLFRRFGRAPDQGFPRGSCLEDIGAYSHQSSRGLTPSTIRQCEN